MIGWAAIRALPWRWIGGGALVLAAVVGILIYGGGKYKAGVAACEASHVLAAGKQQAADQSRMENAASGLAQRERQINEAEIQASRGGGVGAGVRLDADSMRAIQDADAAFAGRAPG